MGLKLKKELNQDNEMWFLEVSKDHQTDESFLRLWCAVVDQQQHEFIDKIIHKEDFGILKDKDGSISITDYINTVLIKKNSIPSLFRNLKKIMEDKTK